MFKPKNRYVHLENPNLTFRQRYDPTKPYMCLLHIAKTGGTSLIYSIERSRDPIKHERLITCRHGDRPISTRYFYGPFRKMGLIIRDPYDRFISGFYCRKRKGKPDYNVPWNPIETEVFSTFNHPGDFALALASSDEKEREFALEAIKSLSHLRRGYRFYFYHPRGVKRYSRAIKLCMPIEYLTPKMDEVMSLLDFDTYKPARKKRVRQAAPERPRPLSPQEEAALRKYLVPEYDIYQALRDISRARHGV